MTADGQKQNKMAATEEAATQRDRVTATGSGIPTRLSPSFYKIIISDGVVHGYLSSDRRGFDWEVPPGADSGAPAEEVCVSAFVSGEMVEFLSGRIVWVLFRVGSLLQLV